VSLVDLGPTVLNLAGVKLPAYMQGQPFLGANLPAPRKYVYGTRDRMDETYDMFRVVRDGRYKYIRNYMPQRPYAQSHSYGDNSDIMSEWHRLDAAGELNAEQALFMRDSKPAEELYDLKTDPYELHNLADDPQHAAMRQKLSNELDVWMLSIRDLGVVPEAMLERTVPRNGTRYGLFRGADGEAQYARFADAAKNRQGSPPMAHATGSETSSIGSEPVADDSNRVFEAEQALNDVAADAAARDEALSVLLEIFDQGQNRWDQIAAANVLDLHVAGTPHVEELGRINKRVKGQPRKNRSKGPEFNSLQPWLNRFSERFPAKD
jgi:uncharacterized sulfatase